jgi:hypothetical protein
MIELREEACAVGAVSGHLALLVVGEPRQGGGQIEDGLWQGNLEQEAHGTQTQGQHRQRRPRRAGRADLRLRALGGPPLSPPAAARLGAGRQRQRRGP